MKTIIALIAVTFVATGCAGVPSTPCANGRAKVNNEGSPVLTCPVGRTLYTLNDAAKVARVVPGDGLGTPRNLSK